MGPFDFLLHLANFAAPALGLALLLVAAARLLGLNRPAAPPAWAQVAVVFAAGLAVLGVGLWWFGRDGKMVTYGALVGVAATVQWLLTGAWRR
ncbi:hypothetical protein [Ramlibacter tataouinensis]|nr:hypothetical protein [Ramlibacter tataouinensis]